jgi:hypothetical protein
VTIIKKKTWSILVLMALVVIVFVGVLSYYVFVIAGEQKEVVVEPVTMYDDRISPDINQGLTVEVLRIRNRGLMEKMLTFGTSWKNTPSFYWIMDVDGKVCDSLGYVGLGSSGTFVTWDTLGLETKQNFFVPQEQETSTVRISIMEVVSSGLLGRRATNVEKETIEVVYDYRTGRWSGDDNMMDADGYGHYLGDSYEVWLNLYQADFDHDGIPYWIEVNVLGTDPTVDDRRLDPDGDGIPTSWEWKWGYDPFVWDDHLNLDPDVDGVENDEDYQMREWLADPYQPDIYIETDGMLKGRLFDINHVFWKESQQMVIERFAQHGIWVFIDDGWNDGPVNGGGEMVPFIEQIDDIVGGQIKAFYEHYFADERKGVFRYVLIANKLGWISPSEYNHYDTINVGTSLRQARKMYLAFTPRYHRVVLAKKVLHELGHSIGLMPITFPGNDITTPVGVRYPNMPKDEYEMYLNEYHSIMNYKWMWMDRKLFDYSDGANGPPYDQNDWKYIYVPSFEIDAISYEECCDESFEDFEVVDKYQGVQLKDWVYDENATTQNLATLQNYVFVKNAKCSMRVYVNTEETGQNGSEIRVYAMPNVSPVHAVWSLVAQGRLTADNTIVFYSEPALIQEAMMNIELEV